MLQAIDIVPRNPELLESQGHALQVDTSPTNKVSSGRGENSKVKKEAESGLETDDSDEDSMREKALLVRFWISLLIYWMFIIGFSRLKFRDARLRLRESGRPGEGTQRKVNDRKKSWRRKTNLSLRQAKLLI